MCEYDSELFTQWRSQLDLYNCTRSKVQSCCVCAKTTLLLRIKLWMSEAASSRGESLIRSTFLSTCAAWDSNPQPLGFVVLYQLSYRNKRTCGGTGAQKCPSRGRIRLEPLKTLRWDAEVRHSSKSWLAAVTRTVEWRTGAMCVSQWLTCFQKSQDLMALETPDITVNIWIEI